jgi:hypothetical protein
MGCLVDGLPPRNAYRMEKVQLGLRCTKPLYSCGFEEPCRWLQCGFGVGKVNGKSPISTGFFGISSVFADFWPIFLDFGSIRRCDSLHLALDADICQATAEPFYLNPKSTFLFGACAAAMGVLRASTTGAAILK